MAESCRGSARFLSTPSARRATARIRISSIAVSGFLSTPSARRATDDSVPHGDHAGISIHALREEGDIDCAHGLPAHKNFYPRPPRGGRRELLDIRQDEIGISIHALREEGDSLARWNPTVIMQISIHALREEGDSPTTTRDWQHWAFLSTPSARRATTRAKRQ